MVHIEHSNLIDNAFLKYSVFSEKVPAYEKLWFIADEFGYQSYEDHFRKRSHKPYSVYIKENFDVTAFINGKFKSKDPSVVSRLRNALVTAVTKQPVLPKLVVIVPDDDMIKFLNIYAAGISKSLGKIVDYIMLEHDKIIESFKEYLDDRSKKAEYPHFLWILAPLHQNFANNEERKKFNRCVERMTAFHGNTSALYLKKVWDSNDTNLFVKESRRFTSVGYARYWEAIDKTVRYCDTIKLRNYTKRKTGEEVQDTQSRNNSRYCWFKQKANKKPNAKFARNNDFGRRRLPSPPPMK